jgi:hypothetical protein
MNIESYISNKFPPHTHLCLFFFFFFFFFRFHFFFPPSQEMRPALGEGIAPAVLVPPAGSKGKRSAKRGGVSDDGTPIFILPCALEDAARLLDGAAPGAFVLSADDTLLDDDTGPSARRCVQPLSMRRCGMHGDKGMR